MRLPGLQTALLAGVALLLLALAVPNSIASLWELRPAAYLESAQATKKALTAEQLNVIKPELEAALHVRETAQTFENLAIVNMHLARLAGSDDKQRAALLADAARALRSSLAYACANPYVWLYLAEIGAKLHQDPNVITDELAMSLLTGRAENGLYLERLNLAFEFYPAANDDTRALIAQQLRLAWQSKRNEILKLVLHYKMDAVLSAALSYTPAGR
ncbi:MAG: hypothetical protein ACU837_11435 [Gammaproteobacteria bacterium]